MTSRRGVVLVAVLGLGGLFVGTLVLVGAMMGSVPEDSSGCSTDLAQAEAPASGGPTVGDLTPAQLANADAVIAEGRRRHIPGQGIVVALAVASQESRFTNYANDGQGGDLNFLQQGVTQSLSLPHEAVGTDHGSVGVFQQQWPWWGDLSDLMNPARSAGKFYDSLLQVPGWQSMPVTVAAQRVQRSAYPDAYADDEPLARELLGGRGGAATIDDAAWTASAAGACSSPVARGPVVYPLPRGSGYVDNQNWGNHGGRWAREHTGTDLSVACGTPVLAATSGTVVVRTDQSWAGKWLVQVSTGVGQLTTWYGHMRALAVADGDTVTAGEQIGEVGDLGNATGCHLHFEVHPQGGSIYRDSVNPTTWLSNNVGRESGRSVETVSDARSGFGEDAFTLATFNTLGSSHTAAAGKRPEMASGPVRTAGVIQLFAKYGVDVAGLQEFQGAQYAAFVAGAATTFALWSPPGDTENSIVWRRSRWEFVSATSFTIPYFDGHPRWMPVVRLRDRATRQVVVFVNVHNPADTSRYRHQSRWRELAVAREVDLVRRLATGDAPVFVTGDMNDSRGTFCELTAGGLMAAANGGQTTASCSPPSGTGIDWIFGTGGTTFSHFTVDHSSLVHSTSDHPFVVTRASVR